MIILFFIIPENAIILKNLLEAIPKTSELLMLEHLIKIHNLNCTMKRMVL